VLIKMIRRAPISGAQCPESAPINFTHKTAAAFNVPASRCICRGRFFVSTITAEPPPRGSVSSACNAFNCD
jgi:hypothetical protein